MKKSTSITETPFYTYEKHGTLHRVARTTTSRSTENSKAFIGFPTFRFIVLLVENQIQAKKIENLCYDSARDTKTPHSSQLFCF